MEQFRYIGKETGRTGNRRKNRDHPDHSIAMIRENTEKSPVTQTPVKNHQLVRVGKTRQEIIIIIIVTMIIIIIIIKNQSYQSGNR